MKKGPYYINERWPEGDSKQGVYYVLYIEGMRRRHYYTVADLRTAIQQAQHESRKITRAVRMCNGSAQEFTPETSREKTDRENRNHCECIALEMESYAAGEVCRCSECGETIYLPDGVGDRYRCPRCGNVADVDEYEQLSLWDYLSDVFDVEYRIDGRGEYRSVRLMVACGGPNIYIDTASKQVELYWWSDRASYPISYEVCDEIDAINEEMWRCM